MLVVNVHIIKGCGNNNDTLGNNYNHWDALSASMSCLFPGNTSVHRFADNKSFIFFN